jgi:GNAT superfamily N-acetyltransferase
VTGVYGVGKTTVIEEMAELLESAGLSFGAIDLDWLWWFYVPSLDDDSVDRIGLANLSAVARNYIGGGVGHLLLAGAIEDATDIEELCRAIRCPLRVVRLTLPLPEIQARLAEAPTTGRQNDLRQTEEWVREGFRSGNR